MGNIFNKKKYQSFSSDRGLLMDNIQSNIDDTKKENDELKGDLIIWKIKLLILFQQQAKNYHQLN